MNISLENWLRNKLQETEENHQYDVATETVKIWIDQHRLLNQPIKTEQLCGYFQLDLRSSSATRCKCGREKWEHSN